MLSETHCPLCEASGISFYLEDRRRTYLQCDTCELVFVPPQWYLDPDREKAEYLLHQNNINDPGYRTFLSRLMIPLRSRLAPGSQGLDFGCGPGPALAQMFREAGFVMTIYDRIFTPDVSAFDGNYDFVCATEVVEHLHHPGRELDRLWATLSRGGWLGIMTKLVRDPTAFATWHYKNDPTHVCFFSVSTWHWWAQQRNAHLEILGADVILLQRQD
jgi:hypothetical protein